MSVLKRKAFVRYYLGEAQGNATKAAILAGYSEHTAPQIGSRLLRRPDIKEAVQARQERLAKKADVTAERVIKELAVIAFSDIRGLFDEHGKLKPVHELPEEVARSLASVEISKERTRKDGEVITDEWVSKLKTWDKPKALEMLGRHLAMWQDKGDGTSQRITVNIGFLTSPHSQPEIVQVMASPARVLPSGDDAE